MVTILKKPTDDSKGILVFTHKEKYIFESYSSILIPIFAGIKQSYVAGMHWGFFQPNNQNFDLIDFHLATKSAVEFKDQNSSKIIDMVSRNFIPDYLEPSSKKPIYDILYIGRLSKVKRVHEILDVFKRLSNIDVDFSALLILNGPGTPNRLNSSFDTKSVEYYENYFKHMKNVTFVYQNNKFDLFPHVILKDIYNYAKCFTLFTQREGESRVIHEALMCGTPVVVREDLKGGGRDYLDETNSFQFGTLDEAVEIFTEIAESEDVGFDPSYLRQSLSAEYTTDQLEAELRDVFDSLGEPFEGQIDTENLEFKLPGHVATLPDGIGSDTSNDLRNLMQLYRFVEYATDADLPEGRLFMLRLLTTDLLSVRLPRWMKTRVEVMIRILDDKLALPIYEELWHLYHQLRS
jgi:glycosyltransferase involved in cell wall biosynthesis